MISVHSHLSRVLIIMSDTYILPCLVAKAYSIISLGLPLPLFPSNFPVFMKWSNFPHLKSVQRVWIVYSVFRSIFNFKTPLWYAVTNDNRDLAILFDCYSRHLLILESFSQSPSIETTPYYTFIPQINQIRKMIYT